MLHVFQGRIMVFLALLSAFAVAWAGDTSVIVPSCFALR